jgi:hypothetical protein
LLKEDAMLSITTPRIKNITRYKKNPAEQKNRVKKRKKKKQIAKYKKLDTLLLKKRVQSRWKKKPSSIDSSRVSEDEPAILISKNLWA